MVPTQLLTQFASYALSWRVYRLVHKAEHSSCATVGVEIEYIYTSARPLVFMLQTGANLKCYSWLHISRENWIFMGWRSTSLHLPTYYETRYTKHTRVTKMRERIALLKICFPPQYKHTTLEKLHTSYFERISYCFAAFGILGFVNNRTEKRILQNTYTAT
jgi:hypothetical protein